MAADLSFDVLPLDAWSAAMGLCARAFFDEPFVREIYGSDPIERFAGIHALYGTGAPQDFDYCIAAHAGTALVGLVRCSPAGHCHVCAHGGLGDRPSDPALGIDWEFERNVRLAHADQGDHAWVSRVAVEPVLRGTGIGRSVMAAALADLEAAGAAAVLLECQDHRVGFYEACGFATVGTFPDPAGPDAHLMRADR